MTAGCLVSEGSMGAVVSVSMAVLVGLPVAPWTGAAQGARLVGG